jgi:hypothetical protein
MSIFKNEKVQLNLPGWKTREDIFTEKDLIKINKTRKMYSYFFDIYVCISLFYWFLCFQSF